MNSTKDEHPHISVLQNEMLEFFSESQIEIFYEGTVGAGGHAEAMLKAHPEIKRYLACDQDINALELAKERLKPWADKVDFIHGNFSRVNHYLSERGIKKVDGFFLT